MFEEKAALLKENNLVYAILSVERKEVSLYLSCKYLDELASIDESKIKACDEAYDRLKTQVKAEPKWKAAAKEKEKSAAPSISAEKEIISPVKLQLDANRIRLSEILALKELFREYPGKSPIELQFYNCEKRLGSIYIDASWGVKVDAPFKAKLQALAEKWGSIRLSV